MILQEYLIVFAFVLLLATVRFGLPLLLTFGLSLILGVFARPSV